MIEPESISSSESIESTSWSIRNKPQMHKLVECLCNIHNDLCDTCSIVTEYFSVKMTTVVAAGFLSTVLDTYQIYMRLYGVPDEDAIPDKEIPEQERIESIHLILQTIMVFLGIFLYCSAGQSVTNQV